MAGLVAAFVFAVQMLELPGRRRHERPSPRRRAGGGARRALGGRGLRRGRPDASRPCSSRTAASPHWASTSSTWRSSPRSAATGCFSSSAGCSLALEAGIAAASGVAATIGVVLASLAFVVEYAIGGTGDASVATVAGAMVGVHLLIGIGEGFITAITVSARPRGPARPRSTEHPTSYPTLDLVPRPCVSWRNRRDAGSGSARSSLPASRWRAPSCLLREPRSEQQARRARQGRDRARASPARSDRMPSTTSPPRATR